MEIITRNNLYILLSESVSGSDSTEIITRDNLYILLSESVSGSVEIITRNNLFLFCYRNQLKLSRVIIFVQESESVQESVDAVEIITRNNL
jgi:hypothetical protein